LSVVQGREKVEDEQNFVDATINKVSDKEDGPYRGTQEGDAFGDGARDAVPQWVGVEGV
jgi:hypothetical protein